MDSQLNSTFEAMKKSKELEQQNQLHNLFFRSKYNNFTESASAGGGIHAVNTGSLSSRFNNLQQAFKDDIGSTKPFKEFKTLYTTKSYENDDVENDIDVATVNTPRSINDSIHKSKYSFADLTSPSNCKMDSSKQNCFDDDDKLANSTQISALLLNDYSPSSNHIRMNFIMLIGFLAGLLISKVLQCIQIYLNWLLLQVLQFRNNLIGTMSLWIFLNFDDTRRLQVRSKLLLLPLVFVCSLFYCLIYVLHFLVRFLLTAAPEGLIKFVHNLHK